MTRAVYTVEAHKTRGFGVPGVKNDLGVWARLIVSWSVSGAIVSTARPSRNLVLRNGLLASRNAWLIAMLEVTKRNTRSGGMVLYQSSQYS